MLQVIGKGILYFLSLIDYAILFRVILGWFMDPYSRLMQALIAVTEPFLAPVRALLGRIFGEMMFIDFSPIITMLLLNAVSQVLMAVFF